MSDARTRARAERLPPLLRGRRRGLLGRLVGLACLQSAAAVTLAVAVGGLVSATGPGVGDALLLLVAVVTAAGAAYGVRVVAEQLGQDYVQELRELLVRSALCAERSPSLGITIARSTNDLTGVRGWVAEGIAPLVAAVPLLGGTLALLAVLHPAVAAAALMPLVVAGTVTAVLAPWAYRRARRLRRVRGRLASHLTDTLHGREGIRAAGGEDREVRRLADDGQRVARSAVARARAAGTLQAAAAAAAALLPALVVATALGLRLPAAEVATALTVAGVLAAPLAATGRIAELRQNHRAARRVLAPLLAATATATAATATATGSATATATETPADGPVVRPARRGPADGGVRVEGLLEARPGDRIRLTGPDASVVSRVLRDLASPSPGRALVVDGRRCADLAPRDRRRLVGLAATGLPLERGSVARAVRYRRPDRDPADVADVLGRVGLTATVAALEHGERTELRRGGEPLRPDALARLVLARAVYGDPPLLLLDRVDADLGEEGRAVLRRVVGAHPGVVVFVSERPEDVAASWRSVDVTGVTGPAGKVAPTTLSGTPDRSPVRS